MALPADQLVAAVRMAVAEDALLFSPITRRLIEHCAQRPRPRAPDQGHRLRILLRQAHAQSVTQTVCAAVAHYRSRRPSELDRHRLTVWFILIAEQKLGNQAELAFRSTRSIVICQ